MFLTAHQPARPPLCAGCLRHWRPSTEFALQAVIFGHVSVIAVARLAELPVEEDGTGMDDEASGHDGEHLHDAAQRGPLHDDAVAGR